MKIVIFGSSGDLAKRKLFPALSRVDLQGYGMIGYSRTKYDTKFSETLLETGSYSPEFLEKIEYIRGQYDDLSELRGVVGPETIFYFSVPPSVYIPLLKEVSKFDFKAVAIEKPYSDDAASFSEIKEFCSGKVMLIDHYLLKPLVVAIPKLISKSEKIYRLMNGKYVMSVEIVSKEILGGEARHYFDKNGIVKDMVQNHMAELLAVIASDVTEDSIPSSTVRAGVFEDCVIDGENCLYGQYESYSKELHKDSSTETFCVIPVYINSKRWFDVPFIMVAGNGMNEKRTEISIEFKKDAYAKCIDVIRVKDKSGHKTVHIDNIAAVRLVFSIYPRREVFFEITTDGKVFEYILYDKHTVDRIMQSHHGNHRDHEIIFDCLIRGVDFDRSSILEAELLRKIFDSAVISGARERMFYYAKGTDMPVEAETLVKKIKGK